MTPWLDDGDVSLYLGDNLEVLRGLPDRSVHMCATSPPFFGLRDYGTGAWEGGDPDCDHAAVVVNDDRTARNERNEIRDDAAGVYAHPSAWPGGGRQSKLGDRECGRCGARRVDQQIGLEATPDEWVARLVAVFEEVKRVLRDDATLWLELGDSFANKQLVGQPWRLAFALQRAGWFLRSEIIWARLHPNPMPESVTDRPTKSHSTVFLLSKQPRYFYDADAIRHAAVRAGDIPMGAHDRAQDGYTKPGWGNGPVPSMANARSVWTIPTQPTPFAHFATWPEALVRRMILAGTSERGCCPECGAPWTRDVDVEYQPVGDAARQNAEARAARGSHGAIGDGLDGSNGGPQSMTHGRANKVTTTLGWSPSCSCTAAGLANPPSAGEGMTSTSPAAAPVPCTVLDPFAGSATTCLVARNHGRHSIGIELNESYLEIAAKRLQQLSLLSEETHAG